MLNFGETQKALLGSLKPGRTLTPYPLTTGKAALILFSQAENLQARREGSARVSHLLALELSGLRWFMGRLGTRSGDTEQRAAFHSLGVNSENPHARGKKTNHLRPACELQTMPNTEQMWAMALTQKALWKPLPQAK